MKQDLYFHPRYNLVGFRFNLDLFPNVIKISETNEFMVLTKEWIKVGVL